MPNKKEEYEEALPIWQNHEQRITTLEITQTLLGNEFKEIKDVINKGNQDQSKKLDEINSRLFDEFFSKKKVTQTERWKLIGIITGSALGGGGAFYLILEKLLGG